MRKTKENQHRMDRFTLIELLIVVAIIAILAGMLLPALNSALNSSRSIACVSRLKQFGSAAAMYENDHQWLPAAKIKPANSSFKDSLWHQALRPYLGNSQPLTSWNEYLAYLKKFRCPGITSYGTDTLGYSVNSFGLLSLYKKFSPQRTYNGGAVSTDSIHFARSLSKGEAVPGSRIPYIMDGPHNKDTDSSSKETRSYIVNTNYFYGTADVVFDHRHGPYKYNMLMLTGNVMSISDPSKARMNYSMFLK